MFHDLKETNACIRISTHMARTVSITPLHKAWFEFTPTVRGGTQTWGSRMGGGVQIFLREKSWIEDAMVRTPPASIPLVRVSPAQPRTAATHERARREAQSSCIRGFRDGRGIRLRAALRGRMGGRVLRGSHSAVVLSKIGDKTVSAPPAPHRSDTDAGSAGASVEDKPGRQTAGAARIRAQGGREWREWRVWRPHGRKGGFGWPGWVLYRRGAC